MRNDGIVGTARTKWVNTAPKNMIKTMIVKMT